MATIDSGLTLSETPESMVPTRAAADEGLAVDDHKRREHRAGWQRMIDRYLIDWGRNPDQLADEDLVPPSREIVHRAAELAIAARDRSLPPPLRVVPDGEGGICFERRAGVSFQSLNILANGTVELATFEDCQLRSRTRLA